MLILFIEINSIRVLKDLNVLKIAVFFNIISSQCGPGCILEEGQNVSSFAGTLHWSHMLSNLSCNGIVKIAVP